MISASAITRWIGCFARSSCACRIVWRAAATLLHSRASCQARITLLTLLVTVMVCVLVTISVINQ